jgi:hypothetical protein
MVAFYSYILRVSLFIISEGRRKKEEGRRKKEEKRKKKEEGTMSVGFAYAQPNLLTTYVKLNK